MDKNHRLFLKGTIPPPHFPSTISIDGNCKLLLQFKKNISFSSIFLPLKITAVFILMLISPIFHKKYNQYLLCGRYEPGSCQVRAILGIPKAEVRKLCLPGSQRWLHHPLQSLWDTSQFQAHRGASADRQDRGEAGGGDSFGLH